MTLPVKVEETRNCMRCDASLERGSHYVYDTEGNLIENLCLKCGNQADLEEYIKSGKRLRSGFTTSNMLRLYYLDMKKDWYFENRNFLRDLLARVEAQISVDNIYDKIKEFEKEVWFKGLQKIVQESDVKGVSAHSPNFNDFKVLTWSCAGRTMITWEDKDSSVTAIAPEDGNESRMGFQGIDAIESEALRLINLSISLYKEGLLKFEQDKKVSLGI